MSKQEKAEATHQLESKVVNINIGVLGHVDRYGHLLAFHENVFNLLSCADVVARRRW